MTWRASFAPGLLEGSQSADFPVYGALIPGRGGLDHCMRGGVVLRGGGVHCTAEDVHATGGRSIALEGEVRFVTTQINLNRVSILRFLVT